MKSKKRVPLKTKKKFISDDDDDSDDSFREDIRPLPVKKSTKPSEDVNVRKTAEKKRLKLVFRWIEQ
jgi:hypothetical protein